MGKPWNQRQVWSCISVLIAFGTFLLLMSGSHDAAAMSQGGGPVTTVEQVRQIDWKQVDQAMGKPGSLQPGGVYRFSFPRIEVTTIHNHALTDEPRLFYLHFWANDDALTLAHGLRIALEQTNSMQTP